MTAGIFGVACVGVCAAAMFLMDQGSKRFALTRAWPTVVNRQPLYRCRRARIGLAAVWLLAALAAAVLFRTGLWFHSWTALIGLGMALGGAAGNLADIFRCAGVVDFIDVGWWPVFNLADIAIVAGFAVICFSRLNEGYIFAGHFWRP